MAESLIIRDGHREDVPLLLHFIQQLAQHEGLPEKVVATENMLVNQLFSEPVVARFVIAEIDQQPVEYALYFYTFSTYLGRKCLYLEDLYITPEVRGKGYGLALFKYIAKIAIQENCGRLEWSVVNWNEPAIKFYQKMGAEPKKDHSGYHLEGSALNKLSK